MIQVENLSKHFNNFTAVDQLSFTVKEGQLFAFLGTNGAGKTTSISCMTTLLRPDSGTIHVDRLAIGKADHQIRERIGVVFQTSLLDPNLSVRENLVQRTKIYGLNKSRVDELSKLINLEGFIDRRYGILSGGEKRRVDIARALLHRPKILFLDEPTTGLDPQSREQVWSVISELRSSLGLTVLLTTHYMHETEKADQVLVINNGAELASGTPMALRAEHSTPQLSLVPTELPGAKERIITAAQNIINDVTIDQSGGAIVLPVSDSITARRVLSAVDTDIQDFQFIHGTMDDVFINLIGNAT